MSIQNLTFEDVFRYRFKTNWALRNILVNYFVYWRKNRTVETYENCKELKSFLIRNAVFKSHEYDGIERMLVIEGIFQYITFESHDVEVGIINPKYADFIFSVVDDEYGLSYDLSQDDSYEIADFMWNVYNNLDEKGHTPGHLHMGQVAQRLCEDIFEGSVKYNPYRLRGRDYIVFSWAQWLLPITFIAGSRVINKDELVYGIEVGFTRRGNWDPEKEFPTICGTYFGDDISKAAAESKIQLIQLSSLMKLLLWCKKKKDKYSAQQIAEHLHLVFRENMYPLAVGIGIERMEKKLPK